MLPLHIKKYNAIHLRLGDKYLETDKKYIGMKNDNRKYSLRKLYKFINNNKNQHLIFFSDTQKFKLKLKQKFNNIIILNTSDKQVLDAITEFIYHDRV